jgi:hypothetical protein
MPHPPQKLRNKLVHIIVLFLLWFALFCPPHYSVGEEVWVCAGKMLQEGILQCVLSACEADKPVQEAINTYVCTYILNGNQEAGHGTMTLKERQSVLSDKRHTLLP